MLTWQAPQWWWRSLDDAPRRVRAAWPMLAAAEACYKLAITLRNRRYDRLQRAGKLFRASIPVISVGNLTVGGSGKTTLTIHLARMLAGWGLRPAIIARGYGARVGDLNDEMLLAARHCPQAVIVTNPDRARALSDAAVAGACDAAVMDDAFQHRKVLRDLDIVLIDATRGLGNGRLLPAGPLREPLTALARADLILLTRTEQVPAETVRRLKLLTEGATAGRVPVGEVQFKPTGLADLDGNPAEPGEGPAGAFAGIGNFQAFVRSCEMLGLNLRCTMHLPDHVHYDRARVEQLLAWARSHGCQWLVTTEKDAVKLVGLTRDWPVPVRVLRLDVVMDSGTRDLLDGLLAGILKRQAAGSTGTTKGGK